jgi:mannose-6-phosphate isomerase-like protein (cupin superfamily)
MKNNHIKERFCLMTTFLLLGMTLIGQESAYSQTKNIKNNSIKQPQPKVIAFNPDSTSYQEIFEGDKDSVVFYSGVVTIAPNESGHTHSTEIYEEMIVVLEGQGQVRIVNKNNLDLTFGNIALIPPNTEHQIFNTGTKNFKYIYIATKSKDK